MKSLAIVGSAAVATLLLVACGQKGPLYLPKEPAAQNRATLPQTLDPTRSAPPSATPTTPTTAPAPAPATKQP